MSGRRNYSIFWVLCKRSEERKRKLCAPLPKLHGSLLKTKIFLSTMPFRLSTQICWTKRLQSFPKVLCDCLSQPACVWDWALPCIFSGSTKRPLKQCLSAFELRQDSHPHTICSGRYSSLRRNTRKKFLWPSEHTYKEVKRTPLLIATLERCSMREQRAKDQTVFSKPRNISGEPWHLTRSYPKPIYNLESYR